MGKKEKDLFVKKSFRYKDKNDEYTLKLEKHNWWWLLLLLLLFLFVKCSKDITVDCFEPDDDVPIEGVVVTLDYQAHFLFDNWHFLATKNIVCDQTTDSTGTVLFRDLPCSIFSYIFYCLQDFKVSAMSKCHASVEEKHKFHFTRHVGLKMPPRREDLHVKLLDLEAGDPLPDGRLIYKYVERGEEMIDTASADPAGIVTLPQMRYCSVMQLLLGKCYGYADTTKQNIPCQQLLVASDSTSLRLRPLKDRFTFFVKNVDTKEPIPGAECLITLTHPSGKKFGPFKVTTSSDGKGMGFYENAFIRATIDIKASKQPYYRDSLLTGGPWTVEDFIKQDSTTRTIWLKPLPYTKEFFNVDSISGEPIPEVKNKIVVTHPDGKTETFIEVGNRNGVFPISATEDAKVEIVSSKNPCYKTKRTFIPKFKDAEKQISLAPVMVTLGFRTVYANKQPATLIPKCNLEITGSQSGSLKPTDSGKGEFKVTFRRCEALSITASKKDYSTNSITVQRRDYNYLNDDQKRRDIPMKPEFVYQYTGNDRSHTECYDLKEASASFVFTWQTCLVCTMIIVKDDNGNELGRFGVNNPSGQGIVAPYSAGTGSVVLKSPTRQICVYVTDVNGCHCEYTVKSI